MTEQELLRCYASQRSEAAFAELVRQNANLVYSAARRQTGGDAQLAEDVTQAVFVLLARKAATIKSPLTGWLIKAAWYAAREARRAATRRQFHERRAAQMRSEMTSPAPQPQWEDYAPLLDEALAQLREKDRQAVALRYLRGLSLRDVGAALGTSEDAARKRVDRGLARLRGMLAVKTAVPGIAALSTALLSHGTQAAPPPLVSAIIANGGAAAKGSLAAAAAHKAASALMWAKVKTAAAIAAAALPLAAGTPVAVIVLKHELTQASPPAVQSAPAEPAAAPPAAATAAPEAQLEAQAPGVVQLAQWDVLLNDDGTQAIRDLCKPLQTVSRLYDAMFGNGAALRAAVANMIAQNNGQIENASLTMEVAAEPIPNRLEFALQEVQYDDKNPAVGQPQASLEGSVWPSGSVRRIADDRLHLSLLWAVWFRVSGVGLQARGESSHGELVYNGDLTAGDALAFIGPIADPSGQAHHHLIVFEAFKAGSVVRQSNSAWWCLNGPAKTRQWADAARVWSARAASPPASLPAAFVKPLEDQTVVRLVALSRPNQWPLCWWDPQGNAVSGLNAAEVPPLAGDSSADLLACVQITPGPQTLRELGFGDATAAAAAALAYNVFVPISPGDTELTVGVPSGPWTELDRLPPGQKKHQLVRDQCKIEWHIYEAQPKRLAVNLSTRGKISDQLGWASAESPGWSTDSVPGVVFSRSLPGGYGWGGWSSLDQLRLMRRARQWATFAGFAVNPNVTLLAQVSPEDLAALPQRDQKSNPSSTVASLQEKRKIWSAIRPDPTTPMGALRSFLNAVESGDEAAACRLSSATLMTNAPTTEVLRPFVHRLVLAQLVRKKAVARFGPDAFDTRRGDSALLLDLEAELLGQSWQQQPDGSWSASTANFRLQKIVLCKSLDGRWMIDLSSPVRTMMPQYPAAVEQKLKDLDQRLSQQQPLNIDDIQPLLDELMQYI